MNDVTPTKAFFWIMLVNVSLRTQTYFAEMRGLRSQAGHYRDLAANVNLGNVTKVSLFFLNYFYQKIVFSRQFYP